MRRAGLDYHEYADMQVHRDWASFLAEHQPEPSRLFAMTTHGSGVFAEVQFQAGDVLVFGSETRGLSITLRESFPPAQRIRLPMRAGNRSLNLSNAVAVTVYEAWRQNGFAGGGSSACQSGSSEPPDQQRKTRDRDSLRVDDGRFTFA